MTGFPVDVVALARELAPLLRQELAPVEPLLSPKKVAERLGIGERTVRDMIAKKVLPSVKVEGARRVDPVDVEAYLDRQRAADATA